MQMKRVIQRPFEPSHFHTNGHTGGAFGEENIITVAEVFLVVKTLQARKAAGWDEILPEMLKTLKEELF